MAGLLNPTSASSDGHDLEVEAVFYSKTRIKILKTVMSICQLNVSDIARRVGANYVNVKNHLVILEREDILQHRNYGRTLLYRFSQTSKAIAVQNLIEAWNHQ